MGIYGGIQLPNINEQSLDDKKERKQILNYLALLDEKLRYMFQNIDIEENLSEESKGMFLEMGQEIKNLVQDTDGKFSMLTQTVDGINLLVSDPEKGLSAISQKADSISSTVANLSGQVSSVTQTADMLTSRVASVEDDVDDAYSLAEQAADHFSWIVESGTSASRMTLTDEFLEIISDSVEIRADVELYGEMTVWRDDGFDIVGGYIGYATGDDGINASTAGMAMSSRDGDHYFIATNSGVRMTAEDNAIVVMDNQISATEEISISSDRRVKDGIGYDMERYEEFFSKLKPSHYKYTFGNSGRDHIGFIAQDVEEAINESGITTQDFAGLVQLSEESKLIGDYADQYYLRYDNFIALNTHMIQKLMARVSELESKLEALS